MTKRKETKNNPDDIKRKSQDEHEKSVTETNDLIAFEDCVQTTTYALYAPENCPPEKQLENMFGMLGADFSDDDIYDEPKMEMR